MKILKQTLLAILILCTTSLAMGQSYIDKGTMNISGSVSFNSSKTDGSDITQTSFNVEPGLFYSLNRYLALGGQLGYSTSTIKDGNSKETRSLIAVSPGVKISYPLQGNLIPFVKALYSYHKSLSGNPEYKMNTIYWLQVLISLSINMWLYCHKSHTGWHHQPMIMETR